MNFKIQKLLPLSKIVHAGRGSQRGFTLVELLVVIAIIGLLASVVLTSLGSARKKSRDAKRLADMRQLASALELYYNDFSGYPPAASNLQPNYIGAVPTAPNPADSPCITASNTYTYTPTAAPATSYSYTFCLGAATGGYSAGARTLSPSGIQ